MRISGADEPVRRFFSLGILGGGSDWCNYSGCATKSHSGGAVHSLWSFPNWITVIFYTSRLIPSSYEGM